jgi:GNAT superfamily N-acetyltransferase
MWVTEDCGSVAVWAPPGTEELTPVEEDQLVRLVEKFIPGADVHAVLQVLAGFDAAHPHDVAHYYLSIVATHDDHRGHGTGEALLAENLRLVDAEHMPAYLESSNPLNLKRYQRLGFEPTGEIIIADEVPPVTTMWREAR